MRLKTCCYCQLIFQHRTCHNVFSLPFCYFTAESREWKHPPPISSLPNSHQLREGHSTQSCFPPSPEKPSSQNTPRTDVCTALTLQLTANKLVTALFLPPYIWEDPANHIIQKDSKSKYLQNITLYFFCKVTVLG